MEHVFAHLAPPERLPRYAAPLWLTADAPEKRGNASLVTLRGFFIGLPVECVARITLRQPFSLELAQVHGTLRAFSASFTLRSVEEGTELLYRVEADPGIPMLSEDAVRQFLVQHVERLLDRVKLAAERKMLRPRSRPAASRPAALPAVSPAGSDEEATGPGEEAAGPGEEAPGPDEEAPGPDEAVAGEAADEKGQHPPGQTAGSRPERAPGGGRRHRRRRRRRGRGSPPRGPGGAATPPAL